MVEVRGPATMKRVKTARRWLPAIALAAVLFGLSSQPDLRIASEPTLDTILRKLGHLGAYALLAMLVAYALGGTGGADRSWRVLAIVVAYAVSDEMHQAFVPGREPALSDVAIDAVGGVLGLAASRLLKRRLARVDRLALEVELRPDRG